MGGERFPSGGSDKPIKVPMRESVIGNTCHGQRERWQLEPRLPTLVLEALGSLVRVPDETGEALSWEKSEEESHDFSLPRKYGVLHFYTAPDILTTYITLDLFVCLFCV